MAMMMNSNLAGMKIPVPLKVMQMIYHRKAITSGQTKTI